MGWAMASRPVPGLVLEVQVGSKMFVTVRAQITNNPSTGPQTVILDSLSWPCSCPELYV